MTTVRSEQDVALMAHLLRRASFGATRDELDAYLDKGYEATVEELLSPGDCDELPEDLIRRYHVEQSTLRNQTSGKAYWVYRMVTTGCPLQEKMVLFWHRVFATAVTKVIQSRVVNKQIDMFRDYALGSFNDLLLQLSKDPAMLLWLDNHDNRKDSINENYGREVLELFSMGVGNYTEQDVKECARAFTGWSVVNPDYMSIKMRNNTARPYGYMSWQFERHDNEHDHGVKTFLGESGDLDGEDVIDIICRQDATPRFIARHMCHFFVADDVAVPQWPYVPPRDPDLIDKMADAYFESGHDITAMLRAMFNSDTFKSEEARFARIKSPAEMVIGALRMVGGFEVPSKEAYDAAKVSSYMDQDLMNPPSVEGWQGGGDWINTGSYVERVNFASQVWGDAAKPGPRSILDSIRRAANGGPLSPESVVDMCLDHLAPMPITDETRKGLIDYAQTWGELRFDTAEAAAQAEARIVTLVQLVVTTQEYQLA